MKPNYLVTTCAGAASLLILSSCSTSSNLVELDQGKRYAVTQDLVNVYRYPNASVFDKPDAIVRGGQQVRVIAASAREVEIEMADGSVGFVDPAAFGNQLEVPARGNVRPPRMVAPEPRPMIADAPEIEAPEEKPRRRSLFGFGRKNKESAEPVLTDITPDVVPTPDLTIPGTTPAEEFAVAPVEEAKPKRRGLFGWGSREEKSIPETVIVTPESPERASAPVTSTPAWVREDPSPAPVAPVPVQPAPGPRAPIVSPSVPDRITSPVRPSVTLTEPAPPAPTPPPATIGIPGLDIPPAPPAPAVPQPVTPQVPSVPSVPSVPVPSVPAVPTPPSIPGPPPIKTGDLNDLELKPIE